MTVTFRGREVEIVEVTLPQRDRLAELTDTLQGLGANGADVQTVSGWRSLAGPLMECARMFAPSLTDADYAAAKGLGLSAAKSRLQRARQRLKQRMTEVCQVRLDDSGRVSDFVPR